MTKNARIAVCSLAVLVLGTGTSQATLIDRGGGLIYDDVLNVTWMQDAQYSVTSGHDLFGRLNFNDANAFAADAVYVDTVRNTSWDDWRLPSAINSPSSLGYDLTGQSSELAYMYYVNLGLAPNYSHDRFSDAPTSSNYNPFINLAYRGFWTNTVSDYQGQAWMFHFHFGSQELDGMNDEQRVWLVRDGDVTVPEPGTLGLLGLGLAGVGFMRRKRRQA